MRGLSRGLERCLRLILLVGETFSDRAACGTAIPALCNSKALTVVKCFWSFLQYSDRKAECV